MTYKIVLFIFYLNIQAISTAISKESGKNTFTKNNVIQSCIQDMGCDPRLSADLIQNFTASSTLKHPQNKHNVSMLRDDNPQTAWCEGRSDSGIGESLQVTFSHPTRLSKILLSPMYAKSKSTMLNNNRPQRFILMLDNQAINLVVDKYHYNPCGQEMPCDEILDLQSWTLPRELQLKPVSNVKLIIESVIKGRKYDDTCMSEFGFVDISEG